MKPGQEQILKKWVRPLTLPLADLSQVPARIESHVGRGLHILLYRGEHCALHLCLSPRGDTPDALLSSEITSLRQVGDAPLAGAAPVWLQTLFSNLKSVESRPGWSEFLAWAADQPSEILPESFALADTTPTEDTLLLRITGSCDAACGFCSARGSLPDLIEGEWMVREYLTRARRRNFQKVCFSGGEPTRVRQLPAYVRMAKQSGFVHTGLESNGLALSSSPDLLPRLAEAGLDSAVLSLHGSRPEIHDSMLAIRGAFDRALCAAEICLRAGVEVAFNHVLTSKNISDTEDYVEFVARHFSADPPRTILSCCTPTGWARRRPELIPRLGEAAQAYKLALETGKRLGLRLSIPRSAGIPFCVLPDNIGDFDGGTLEAARPSPDRTKVSACKLCAYRKRCPGWWRAYLDLHGDEEIQPISNPSQ